MKRRSIANALMIGANLTVEQDNSFASPPTPPDKLYSESEPRNCLLWLIATRACITVIHVRTDFPVFLFMRISRLIFADRDVGY